MLTSSWWTGTSIPAYKGRCRFAAGKQCEHKQGIRAVVSYDSQPYYIIVTNVGNQEVLDGLNMAMAKIADSNPILHQNGTPPILNASSVDIRLNERKRTISGRRAV